LKKPTFFIKNKDIFFGYKNKWIKKNLNGEAMVFYSMKLSQKFF